jgi:hypothetical protein
MDRVYTQHGEVLMPDHKVVEDKSEYNYEPLRGYSACLAVFDIDDNCIGWIDTRTLGYESAKEWCKATKWIDWHANER